MACYMKKYLGMLSVIHCVKWGINIYVLNLLMDNFTCQEAFCLYNFRILQSYRPANSHGFPVLLINLNIILRSHRNMVKSHECTVL